MRLMLPNEKPSTAAFWLMLCANLLACLQVTDLIPLLPDAYPDDPRILHKLVLCLMTLLSTYGFRAALLLPPPEKKD